MNIKLYIIYYLGIIITCYIINKQIESRKKNCLKVEISDEEYFILQNKKNITKFFYLLVYKLFCERKLVKIENWLVVNKKINAENENDIEKYIIEKYRRGFRTDKFKDEDGIIERYYLEVEAKLVKKNLIGTEQERKKKKITLIVSGIALYIPIILNWNRKISITLAILSTIILIILQRILLNKKTEMGKNLCKEKSEKYLSEKKGIANFFISNKWLNEIVVDIGLKGNSYSGCDENCGSENGD